MRNGKGSARRPGTGYEEGWEAIFGNKPSRDLFVEALVTNELAHRERENKELWRRFAREWVSRYGTAGSQRRARKGPAPHRK